MIPLDRHVVTSGVAGGLIGGVSIWLYEAVVWVGVQHQMPLVGIPRNAVGLVFGNSFRDGLGWQAFPLGTSIHFVFAGLWGVIFAVIWPWFHRRNWEATLLALPFAVVLWVFMHVAIAIAGNEHPNYLDPAVIIGGIMSHIFYAVPMALVVKRRMSDLYI